MTAIKWMRAEPGGSIWLCRCDCGKECEAPGGFLRMGRRKSCGCKTRGILSKLKRVNFQCSAYGCIRSATSKQLCDMHYRRLTKHGSLEKPSKKGPYSVLQRLERGSVMSISGCIEWVRGLTVDGYGQLKIDGHMVHAHRASWMQHRGQIPKGIFVCHRCDNPRCINVEHLFLGTALDNTRDCIQKGRRNNPKGARHWNWGGGKRASE